MDILNEVEVDMARVGGQISVDDLVKTNVAQEDVWKKLHLKESILKQKSRLKWVNEGDQNSKCFHSMLKYRTRRNSITSIQDDSGMVEEVSLVKKVIKENFESRFHSNFI